MTTASICEVAARILPRNAFTRFQKFNPASFGLRMKVGMLLGLLGLFDFLGDSFKNEAVRGGAGRFRCPSDADPELFGQADGDDAHRGLQTAKVGAM